jgi:hypothetical protein
VHDGMQEHIRSQILIILMLQFLMRCICYNVLHRFAKPLSLPAFDTTATAVASTLDEQHCAELLPCLMLLQHVLLLMNLPGSLAHTGVCL